MLCRVRAKWSHLGSPRLTTLHSPNALHPPLPPPPSSIRRTVRTITVPRDLVIPLTSNGHCKSDVLIIDTGADLNVYKDALGTTATVVDGDETRPTGSSSGCCSPANSEPDGKSCCKPASPAACASRECGECDECGESRTSLSCGTSLSPPPTPPPPPPPTTTVMTTVMTRAMATATTRAPTAMTTPTTNTMTTLGKDVYDTLADEDLNEWVGEWSSALLDCSLFPERLRRCLMSLSGSWLLWDLTTFFIPSVLLFSLSPLCITLLFSLLPRPFPVDHFSHSLVLFSSPPSSPLFHFLSIHLSISVSNPTS